MPSYAIATFSYADRVRVLGAVDDLVRTLGPEKSDLSSTGSTTVVVRIEFPEEPLHGRSPEPSP